MKKIWENPGVENLSMQETANDFDLTKPLDGVWVSTTSENGKPIEGQGRGECCS